MKDSKLTLEVKNIRSINHASIILDGITVIAGENGSGKSTISKLAYNLVKTSLEYNKLADKKTSIELYEIYKTLDIISRDLFNVIVEEDYTDLRNIFKINSKNKSRLLHNNIIPKIIESLISIFTYNIVNEVFYHQSFVLRIKHILQDLLKIDGKVDLDVNELLKELKSKYNSIINENKRLIESRPVSLLDNALNEAFYDSPISNDYNLTEYGVPVIDRLNNKLVSLYSVNNVAYIDTPMTLGIKFLGQRNHWEHLNEIIRKRNKENLINGNHQIIQDVIEGDVSFDANSLQQKPFIYKRKDGAEFDLIECATGVKSFAILQLLYKNGLLNNKTLLIIDEPEAHLHPQWVVEYARLIVLLNKNLGVRFLIASHHPDMISAIRYISQKENTTDNLNFYLAQKSIDFKYDYLELKLDIEKIFASFNIALERIDEYGA